MPYLVMELVVEVPAGEFEARRRAIITAAAGHDCNDTAFPWTRCGMRHAASTGTDDEEAAYRWLEH